jgi:hypothetical protein
MNGHDDAAADAALLSKAVARPVRVQWSREDEHGWDPKAPPQLLSLEGAVSDDGKIAAWRPTCGSPKHREPAEHAATGARRRRHRADAGLTTGSSARTAIHRTPSRIRKSSSIG